MKRPPKTRQDKTTIVAGIKWRIETFCSRDRNGWQFCDWTGRRPPFGVAIKLCSHLLHIFELRAPVFLRRTHPHPLPAPRNPLCFCVFNFALWQSLCYFSVSSAPPSCSCCCCCCSSLALLYFFRNCQLPVGNAPISPAPSGLHPCVVFICAILSFYFASPFDKFDSGYFSASPRCRTCSARKMSFDEISKSNIFL